MSVINCPHCDGRFEIRALGAPRIRPTDSPIDRAALRAVLNFMRRLGPCKKTIAELHETYETQREAFEYPTLSKNALARAMKMQGATPWRTGINRGYTVPEIGPDTQPASPKPSVQTLSGRQAYQQALIDHSVDRVVYPQPDGSYSREKPADPLLDELPFK